MQALRARRSPPSWPAVAARCCCPRGPHRLPREAFTDQLHESLLASWRSQRPRSASPAPFPRRLSPARRSAGSGHLVHDCPPSCRSQSAICAASPVGRPAQPITLRDKPARRENISAASPGRAFEGFVAATAGRASYSADTAQRHRPCCTHCGMLACTAVGDPVSSRRCELCSQCALARRGRRRYHPGPLD